MAFIDGVYRSYNNIYPGEILYAIKFKFESV